MACKSPGHVAEEDMRREAGQGAVAQPPEHRAVWRQAQPKRRQGRIRNSQRQDAQQGAGRAAEFLVQQRRRYGLIGQHYLWGPAAGYSAQIHQLPLDLADKDMPQVKAQLPQPSALIPAREGGPERGVVIVAGVDKGFPGGAAGLNPGGILAPGIPADLVPPRAEFPDDGQQRQDMAGNRLRGDQNAQSLVLLWGGLLRRATAW